MDTKAFAIFGTAMLWSACVTTQDAHADDRQISLPPQHSCLSDPEDYRMVFARNDDDCDDSDPTWMPAPPSDVLFDTSDEGFAINLMQPRSLGVLFTDDCDDGDPSWMPAPPFSALVTIGLNGGRAWELPDEVKIRIREFINRSPGAKTYSQDETARILSFTSTGGGRFRQEMQEILDQLSDDNSFIESTLANGQIPYFFLKPRGN